MSRILLINPPYSVRFGQPQGGKYGGAPAGLLYVGTSLGKAGHEVKLMDLHAKPLSEKLLVDEIKSYDPDFCGIGSMSPNHLAACDVARKVKEAKDILIIKGGPHETYCHRTTLQNHPEIDISVFGHGVETVVELVGALESGAGINDVKGISYRIAGNVVSTGTRPFPRHLDSFPHQDRGLLPASDFYNFGIFGGKKTAQVRMSQGCFYGCTFCPIDRNYKFHSIEYMRKELQNIWELGYLAIFFDDAIFTANKPMLEDLAETASSDGMRFEIGGQTRADCNTGSSLLEKLRKWGLSYLSFGLESGDVAILASINKKLGIRDVKEAVERAKGQGIRTALTVVIGFPDETIDSVKKTIDVLNDIKPYSVSFSVFSYYPGSLNDFKPEWYENEKYLAADQLLRNNFDEGYGAKIAKSMAYIYDAWGTINERLNPGIRR